MTEQTPSPAKNTMPVHFSADSALVWLNLLATHEDETFPVDPHELGLLLESYLEFRTQFFLAQRKLTVMTKVMNQARELISSLRVENADMRAALPADWVPARVRNEQDTLATAPQDVANDAPQGDPGDESPGIPAAVAAE